MLSVLSWKSKTNGYAPVPIACKILAKELCEQLNAFTNEVIEPFDCGFSLQIIHHRSDIPKEINLNKYQFFDNK